MSQAKNPLKMPLNQIFMGILFGILSTASNAWPAELKVVDKYGLTRAQKNITELGTVILDVRTSDGQAPAEPIRITNTEGLAPDITAYPEYGGKFSFRNVRPGVWQLVAGKGVEVLEVKITQ